MSSAPNSSRRTPVNTDRLQYAEAPVVRRRDRHAAPKVDASSLATVRELLKEIRRLEEEVCTVVFIDNSRARCRLMLWTRTTNIWLVVWKTFWRRTSLCVVNWVCDMQEGPRFRMASRSGRLAQTLGLLGKSWRSANRLKPRSAIGVRASDR